MLSLHTNNAALSAQNSIGRTQENLSTSMTRLSTGYRINSAMDDAAGLHAHLVRHGVRIVKPLREEEYGLLGFVFADPDGNRIDVGQVI